MLKLESDLIREFPIVNKISRDAENPLVVEFIKNHPDITSILDIGACHSWKNYAPEIRKLVSRYDAIDIVSDPETRKIVDHYITGNVAEMLPIIPEDPYYDAVICVSVLEHCGISTYKEEDYRNERFNVFCRCLELAKKYVWISFDCGQEYLYPNELAPLIEKEVKRLEVITSKYKVKERFLYTQGCQSNHPWYEHTKRDVALHVPYIDFIGNQSVMIMEIEKV